MTNMPEVSGHGRSQQQWSKAWRLTDTATHRLALGQTILLRPLWLRERSLGENVSVAEVGSEKTTLRTAGSQLNVDTLWWHQCHGIVQAV